MPASEKRAERSSVTNLGGKERVSMQKIVWAGDYHCRASRPYGSQMRGTWLNRIASTGYVKNSIRCFRLLIEHVESLGSRQHDQLDLASLGLAFHLLHHWQPAISPSTDDEPAAVPGDLFLYRNGSVAKPSTELL